MASPIEIRALRRLGEPVLPPPRPARRRRREFTVLGSSVAVRTVALRRPLVRRRLLVPVAVFLAGLLWVAGAAQQQANAPAGLADRAAVASSAAASSAPGATGAHLLGPRLPGAQRPARSAARAAHMPAGTFALIDDLPLVLPHPAPVTVAFHEASRAEALPLAPVGTLVSNDNATKFDPGHDTVGPDYRVLSSRGRSRPPTSAVDIVVPQSGAAQALARAPVSGRVVEVKEYALYDSVRDWRVVIEPEERPDLHIVLIHLLRPSVRAGDVVEAGVTPLAVVRLLPFSSHVDYTTEERLPHVHLEVKPAVEPEPVDPNAPALPAKDAEL